MILMNGDVESLEIKDYAENAYLDYSMYVILDRALPNIGDGLKPVQRRIIYAMSELGLSAVSKHKKSARTIGDVIGKFHPHGDSACYEAMVLMAQDFAYRYPLVDGQGNFGSPDDPKSFAAMRYTEARLTAYARVLLSELEQGTVNWTPNFDGTLKEPELLPARLPNILLNGCSGIAVGMSTDIPSHNLREVVDACIYLLNNPKAELEELSQFIKGPDFPTQAEIITPSHEILAMYESGNGSVKQRATFRLENNNIIIDALPYQVSPAKIQEQIASQIITKKMPWIEDVRDESDHEHPTHLVLVPRSNRVDIEMVMNHLFATTDLEKNYRVNLNIIGTNGLPAVKNLLDLLKEWLEFRSDTIKKRISYRLNEVVKHLEILAGYLIAFLNIDEVIAIIRYEDDPKQELITRFNLTDVQAEAILNLRLRNLAKLEEMKIKTEQMELEKERKQLESLLNSSKKLRALLAKELKSDAEKYGDDRRSPIVEREAAQALDKRHLIPNEPVTVILSQKGWVRAAKGHDIDPEKLNYRGDDGYLCSAIGRTQQLALFFDDTGKSYALDAHTLPSARSQGEPLSGKLNVVDQSQFVGVLLGGEENYVLMASTFGYGFITRHKSLITRNKTGKQIITLANTAKLLPPKIIQCNNTDVLVCVTSAGYLLVFPVNELPELNKGKGNKLINISKAALQSGEEYLVDCTVVPETGIDCLIHSGQRYLRLKRSDLEHYLGSRAKRGKKLPRGFQRVDYLSLEKK